MLSGNSSPQHGQRRFPAKPPPRWASKFPKCVGAVWRLRAARQATHCCGKVNFGPGPTEMLSDCNREGSMTADASAQSTNERRRVKSGRAGRSQQDRDRRRPPPLKSGLSRELLREHVREKKQAHGIRGRRAGTAVPSVVCCGISESNTTLIPHLDSAAHDRILDRAIELPKMGLDFRATKCCPLA